MSASRQLRLRLAGRRLRLRRQRLGAAAVREGLLGGRARVRTALRRPRVPARDGRPQALLLEPAPGHEGDLPADDLQGRLGCLRLRRRRRQPRLREHAVRAAEGVLRGPPVGGDGPTGRARWPPTTPRRSGCSASSKTRTRTRPTSCCASSARSSASATPTNGPPSASSSASAGKTVPDPFFGGEGPDRTGCRLCGRCMVGCPHGAKNTLVKNYLYFAEKRGARVMPERTVIDIRPLGAADGSDGYEVESVRSGAWLRKERRVQRARGVVVAAGPLGTNRLLQLLPPERLAAAHLRAPGRAGAHELRVDPGGDGARGLPRRPDQTRRDHLLDLPRPAHPHRDGHLRRRRRLDAPPEHAARRRRHARDAPAEAARADRCCTPSAWRR